MVPHADATMASEYSVSQILTLDKRELVQVMKKNRNAEGDFTIYSIKDWGNVPESQREELATILSAAADQTGAVGQDIDFDQLAARLLKIPDDRAVSRSLLPQDASTPPEGERSPTASPAPDFCDILEREAYDELVKDGGRPAYPINLLSQVFNDPVLYHEMVRPWLEDPDSRKPGDCRQVLRRQRDRWRKFRQWQLDNRGAAADNDTEGFAAYLVDQKNFWEMVGGSQVTADPEFEDAIRKQWKLEQANRLWGWENVREVDSGGDLDGYAAAAARRLAAHEFTQRFQFDQDPRRQEQWTTFVEYLEFECWWFDKFSGDVALLQQQHDAALENLRDFNVLKGSQTEEDLLDDETETQRVIKKEQITRAVDVAKASLASAQQRPASRKHSDLAKAQNKVRAAEELLAATVKKDNLIDEFIKKTAPYRTAKANVRRHDIWMKWIRGELSRIETEATKPYANSRETKRTADEDFPEENSRKKRKLNRDYDHRPGATTPRQAATNYTQPAQKHKAQDRSMSGASVDVKKASNAHKLRRSARVAAAEEARQRTVSADAMAPRIVPARADKRKLAPPNPKRRTPQGPQPKAIKKSTKRKGGKTSSSRRESKYQ